MKMNLKLTADELMDVVDAAVGEAMNRGYDGLDADELTDDMLHIVDATLSAMGIGITEDTDTEDEDEDEDKEEGATLAHIYIKNGKRCISAEDARTLVAYITEKVLADDDIAEEDKYTFIMDTFTSLGEHFHIDFVDCEEEGR